MNWSSNRCHRPRPMAQGITRVRLRSFLNGGPQSSSARLREMLSKKAKYAIQALLYLAERHGQGPVLIKDIAETERLPRKFLEAILVDLKSGGLLRSRPGRSGGYELIRLPSDVNLGHVIRLIDGPLAPIPCVSQMAYAPCADCREERTCLIRLVMKEVRDSTAEILERTTLAGLLKQREVFQAQDGPLDFVI